MEPGFKFAKGEKIICYYEGAPYEAKVLKCSLTDDNQREYYIHYFGWSNKWNEWAVESRLEKYNDTNVELEDELAGDIDTSINTNQRDEAGSHSDSSHSTNIIDIELSDSDGREGSLEDEITATTRYSDDGNTNEIESFDSAGEEDSLEDEISATTRYSDDGNINEIESFDSAGEEGSLEDEITVTARYSGDGNFVETESFDSAGAEDSLEDGTASGSGSMSDVDVDVQVETEEEILPKVEIKIEIPDKLKNILIMDWYAITHESKLPTVPAKVTVQEIVKQYIEFKKNLMEQENTEMLAGLIDYFNAVLDKKLLYEEEENQYNQVLNQNSSTPMSELYGLTHMIRLFVKLGPLLECTQLDQVSSNIVLEQIADFMKFLAENSAKYFNINDFE